jgi:hypothetical protein
MMDPSMHVVWANGQEWVVKREHHHYFYRLENDYGAWKKGTPPGTCQADMDMIFHT